MITWFVFHRSMGISSYTNKVQGFYQHLECKVKIRLGKPQCCTDYSHKGWGGGGHKKDKNTTTLHRIT